MTEEPDADADSAPHAGPATGGTFLRSVAIPSWRTWMPTGIAVEAGQLYRFSAAGQWTDLATSCGPEGYERPWLDHFRHLRVLPKAHWFELIGAVDANSATLFRIGDRGNKPWRAPVSGELTCCANDAWFMRWNNFGEVQLTVYVL